MVNADSIPVWELIVKFPVLHKIGLDKLAEFENPIAIIGFVVERVPYANQPLQVVQTQPRSRAKK